MYCKIYVYALYIYCKGLLFRAKVPTDKESSLLDLVAGPGLFCPSWHSEFQISLSTFYAEKVATDKGCSIFSAFSRLFHNHEQFDYFT